MAMQFWQRFTLVTLGALALHGAALWALQTLKLRSDLADKAPALLTRILELPKLEELKLPPPQPPPPPKAVTPPPPPKPVTPPPPAKAAPSLAPPTFPPRPVSQPSAAPVASPAPAPLALNNPSPAPNAPTGSVTPEPYAPAPTAPAPVAASPATAPAAQPAVKTESNTASTSGSTRKATGSSVQAIEVIEPNYPERLARLGQMGRVLIEFDVDLEGRTVNARVAKSSGFARLDNEALNAARETRYKPASCDGKVVVVRHSRYYNFGVLPLPTPPLAEMDCSAR